MRELSLAKAVQRVALFDEDLRSVLWGDELAIGPGNSARVSLPEVQETSTDNE